MVILFDPWGLVWIAVAIYSAESMKTLICTHNIIKNDATHQKHCTFIQIHQ